MPQETHHGAPPSRRPPSDPAIVRAWRARATHSAFQSLVALPILIAAYLQHPDSPAQQAVGFISGAVIIVLAVMSLLRYRTPRTRSISRSRGPHRADFTPLDLLGRSAEDAPICALVAVSAIVLAPSHARELSIWTGSIGALLGYITWRRRPGRAWAQLLLCTLLPLALAALLVFAAADTGMKFVSAAALLSGAGFGSSLAALAERVSRRRPQQLRVAWRGVDVVVGEAGGERAGDHDPYLDGAAGDPRVRFDVRPLVQRVRRREARAFPIDQSMQQSRLRSGMLKWLFLLVGPVILVILPVAFTDEDYTTGPDAAAQMIGMAAFFSLLVLAYLIIGFVGMRSWRQLLSRANFLRLSRFAAANGFDFEAGPRTDQRGNRLSSIMRRRGWLLTNAEKAVDQPGGSAAPVTQFSGVAEFRLPVPLPHLLLLRRGPRTPTFSSYLVPRRDQRLRLEGDFNRYFDVYCPRGYERDALYLLTPDVMAALIDGARRFDIEIIDDRLFLRSRRDIVTVDPGVWLTIAQAVAALHDRTRQWRLWRDDRSSGAGAADGGTARPISGVDAHRFDAGSPPRLLTERPHGAAQQGRRLRGGLGLGAALIAAYAVLFIGMTWLANTL